jgi:hypothetical protein
LETSANSDATLRAGAGIQVTPMIEAEYPLRDGLDAFEHAARPGARKILLRPN